MKNIHIKLLEGNIVSLSCQIKSLLQQKDEMEEKRKRIKVLETEYETLRQEDTPTKGWFQK
jgi:hypothetical protein